MYKFKDGDMRVPAYVWAEEGAIENSAIQQLVTLAQLPFAFHHVVLCPDGHMGYGMPIGGVLATEGVVVPNAVGVDIGCGMCAVKTSLVNLDIEILKKLMGRIREIIPVGFSHQAQKQDESLMPAVSMGIIATRQYEAALTQLGTLGGGNHFIEIQKGSDGHIWIMLHSGSRNLGFKSAEYHNEVAKKLNAKYFSAVPAEWDLAFLPLDSDEAKEYLLDMNYCVEFAHANRMLMVDRIKECFTEILSGSMDVGFALAINIAHNYARMEHHYSSQVMVHRKGATLARKGTVGIIPGSQGTKSYIVIGKGSSDSFESCSHGAGRAMGRNQARKTLSLESEIKKLEDLGVVHSIRKQEDLDEAPSAYKDIDVVMQNQQDLVEISVELTPLAVIKG